MKLMIKEKNVWRRISIAYLVACSLIIFLLYLKSLGNSSSILCILLGPFGLAFESGIVGIISLLTSIVTLHIFIYSYVFKFSKDLSELIFASSVIIWIAFGAFTAYFHSIP